MFILPSGPRIPFGEDERAEPVGFYTSRRAPDPHSDLACMEFKLLAVTLTTTAIYSTQK